MTQTHKNWMCLFTLLTVAAGCQSDGHSPYDPDWDADGPIADGKADGIIDIAPAVTIGGAAVTGDVGGENVELFRVELQRTDRIEIAMTVTGGDLNPHITLYNGTSTYVGSESWNREGNTLRKVYGAEYAGSYLIAARAFRAEGSGSFSIAVTCLSGPCAGELPPPENELELDQVAQCITQARRCSFERVPAFGGAVAEIRANQIFTECMNEASLEDGSSCADACAWTGDSPDATYDDAVSLCDEIKASLIFYADQTSQCLGLVDDCMETCFDIGRYNYFDSEDLWTTTEALCFSDGFNGNCDSYARAHEPCGGNVRVDGARSCYEFCYSTTGAHTDDLDTLCYDESCEDYCHVDIEQAGEECGGLSMDNETCLYEWIDDTLEMESCDEYLAEAIEPQ